LGAFVPCPHRPLAEGEGEGGKGREDPKVVHKHTGAAMKTRRPPVELQDAEKPRTAMHQHPLLPLLCAATFFLTDDPASHLNTDACTSAHGH
jgi:hypothetical protein